MIDQETERKLINILKILSLEKEPIGSFIISRRLKEVGYELSERTVRYYLKMLDEKGMTKAYGKTGRTITSKGLKELDDALVHDKVGFVISRIEHLAYLTEFDFRKGKGKVPVNISLIKEKDTDRAAAILEEVYKNNLALSSRIALISSGCSLNGIKIESGLLGMATICSVAINGILIKSGIPVYPRFGAILEVKENRPVRFTELISYEGSSLDPLEIFIKSKMTTIDRILKTGNGKMLASLREIPEISTGKAEEIVGNLKKIGFTGLVEIGKPGKPLFGVSVNPGKTGIVVEGGLNPLAALNENEIWTENRAMHGMVDFEILRPALEALRGWRQRR